MSEEEKKKKKTVVHFSNTPTEKEQNNNNLKIGLVLGVLLCVLYGIISFLSHSEKTLPTDQQEMSLLDLGFSPFVSNETLPNSKIKFYEKNPQGEWVEQEKSLRDLIGKPMIVHLWATFCGPCVQELPNYDTFTKENDDIQHLAVVVGRSTPKDIESFYEKKNIQHLKIIIDEKNAIPQAYKIQGIPTTIFINSIGKPLGYITGAVEWNDPSSKSLIRKLFDLQ